jgi:hypothetical protein
MDIDIFMVELGVVLLLLLSSALVWQLPDYLALSRKDEER